MNPGLISECRRAGNGWSAVLMSTALILAGLIADGETTFTGLEHVERGYDDLVGRLSALGAHIERFS